MKTLSEAVKASIAEPNRIKIASVTAWFVFVDGVQHELEPDITPDEVDAMYAKTKGKQQ